MSSSKRAYGKSLVFISFCVIPAVVSELTRGFSPNMPEQRNSAFQEYLARTQPHLGAFFRVQSDSKSSTEKPGSVPDFEVMFPKQVGIAWSQ